MAAIFAAISFQGHITVYCGAVGGVSVAPPAGAPVSGAGEVSGAGVVGAGVESGAGGGGAGSAAGGSGVRLVPGVSGAVSAAVGSGASGSSVSPVSIAL